MFVVTRKEAYEKFLATKGSRFYLQCSIGMTAYMGICYLALLIATLVTLKFAGQTIIFIVAGFAAMFSCYLLFNSSRKLYAHVCGKKTNLLKAVQSVHLGVGMQLLFSPLICMCFCVLMAELDAPGVQEPSMYAFRSFRMTWEIFGIIVLACTIFKLMSCRSIEAHIVKDAGNFLPFFLLELFYIIESGVLTYILCAFPTAQPAGIVMRVLFIPIILYHLVSAGFFISYIKFAKENGLVAEAIQRRKEAKKKRNDQQQK